MVKSPECGFDSRPWHLCPWARLFTQGYTCKWVPVRVEVDIVYEIAFGALQQLLAVYSPGSWKRLKGCYWPNDEGTFIKRIDIVIVNSATAAEEGFNASCVFGYGFEPVRSPKINPKLGRVWWNRRPGLWVYWPDTKISGLRSRVKFEPCIDWHFDVELFMLSPRLSRRKEIVWCVFSPAKLSHWNPCWRMIQR